MSHRGDQNKRYPGGGRGNQNSRSSGKKDDNKSSHGRGGQNSRSSCSKEDYSVGNSKKSQSNEQNKNNPNFKSLGKKDDNVKEKPNKTAQKNSSDKRTVSKEHQAFTQKTTSLNIGFNNTQQLINSTTNMLSNKSESPGFLQLAMNALSHLSLNIESTTVEASKKLSNQSNTSKQGRSNFQIRNRGNNRGFVKKMPNAGDHSRFKSPGTPVELRVHSGKQESNTPVKQFRPRVNVVRNRFYQPRPNAQTNLKPSFPTSQFQFMSPNQFAPPSYCPPRYSDDSQRPTQLGRQNYEQPIVDGNTNQALPKYNDQHNFSNQRYTPNESSASTGYISPQVKAPIFKSKKSKSTAQKSNKASNLKTDTFSSDNLGKPPKRLPKKSRKQYFSQKSKQASANKTATPLLSFQRILPAASDTRNNSASSDENDTVSLSRFSSDESIWTTTISDEGSSDESEVTSEISTSSSFRDSGIASSASELGFSSVSNSYKTIAYYWDIENCPIPRQKSPTDFVKRVRETFSSGRSEFEFTAVCDVTRLNETIAEELDRASVNIMHVSYINKNAADAKIKSLLQEFPDKCRSSGDYAVVLISGDSDFANTLNNLKYKYRVLIYLICKNDARHALIEASDQYHFYEDFVQDLPNRSAENKISFIITLNNFPVTMKSKQIKNFVNDKVKGLNCRIKILDGKVAEIYFPNETLREKALPLFRNLVLSGNEIYSVNSERETSKLAQGKSDSNKKLKPNEHIKKTFLNDNPTNEEDKKNSHQNKGAILCVCVGIEPGNVMFWKLEFKKLWNTTDFDLQWEDRDGGYFLVKFKSLSQAQKARKILQKAQSKSPNSPKFLKLIKQDDVSVNLSVDHSIQDSISQNIEKQILIVKSKRDSCLNKYKAHMHNLKLKAENSAPEIVETLCNALNEQKVMFLNVSSSTIEKIERMKTTSSPVKDDLDYIIRDYNRECNLFTSFLPIYGKRNILLKKIKKHQVVILQADSGFGKSTQLAQYIWCDETISKNGLVICSQPHKIAAFNLAKHVSSQINCSLGDIVGYHVNSVRKISPKTKILYATDDLVLHMLKNNDFEKISCIIVDEAHERTVNTDLLFSVLKNILPSKPELKLIITSAILDNSVFIDYFQLHNDSVLEIFWKKFPVEDNWSSSDVVHCCDYFSEVIDKVTDIISKEKEGDILAFVTSSFETEKAEIILLNKLTDQEKQSVQIFQLHENLDATQLQKLFSHNTKGIRKVVFSTNIAETAINLPNIKFVVDCGFVKRLHYDFIQNEYVASLEFVSQSCVEQRKSCAGRTEVGKCYHLYSQADFDKMSKFKDSEILHGNPSNIVLKLIKLGLNDPSEFKLIESSSPILSRALECAREQLIQSEIISEDYMTLSNLGNKLSSLPFEPRLGLLILEGIENDIGFEAIVLSSLITVSRNNFFRISDVESAVGFKKIRICQNSNDFITYLEIFKEWMGVPKQAKSKWCVLNCINAQSIQFTQDLVNEVLHVLSKEANIKIIPKFNSTNVHEKLLEIILHNFYQKLCIYSGHRNFGYKSLVVSENLFIHPSSSLFSCRDPPKFLVYDSVLRTDKTYLLNICPISEEMLLDFEEVHKISLNLEDLKTLPLQKYVISPIGKMIILHDIIGKGCIQKKNIESTFKGLIGNDLVVVEADIPKGEVLIYAPQSKEDLVQSIIYPLISKAQERLLLEEKEMNIFPHLVSLLTAGANIKALVFPGEFRDLKLVLGNQAELSVAVEKLQTCGTVNTVVEFKNYFKITYENPNDAQQALQRFEKEKSFVLSNLGKSNNFGLEAKCYKMQVSFIRRKCTGLAFVAIEPLTAVQEVLDRFQNRIAIYRNSDITFSINAKTQDILIKGLPKDTEHNDFVEFLKKHLREEYKITKCIVIRDPVYESDNKELDTLKQLLLDLFSRYTSKLKLSVRLIKASSKDIKWHAFVCFQDFQDGERAVAALKKQKEVPGIIGLNLKPTIQTFLYAKLEVFSAVKVQIEKTLESFKDSCAENENLGVTVVPKGENYVQIQITSNKVSDLTEARKVISKYLMGKRVYFGNERIFSKRGQLYVKKISDDNPDCYIEINEDKSLITYFGSEAVYDEIKAEIGKFLENMVDDDFGEINLFTEENKPGALKSLIMNYGYDLKKLEEICSATIIEVDLQNHLLLVNGSGTSISQCQDIVSDIKAKLDDVMCDEIEEPCPICHLKVSDQHHRLEYCGHAYCKDCLLHLFVKANEYPLCCISCGSLIVLPDLQWALKDGNLSTIDLFKKPLQLYIQDRTDIGYCPSPDCSMIFRMTSEEKVFECPACSNFVCTRCCLLHHYGASCSQETDDFILKDQVLPQFEVVNVSDPVEESSILTKLPTDESDLQAWLRNDPYFHKLCPLCSSPIQRSGEKIIIMCWQCKEYFCWSCEQVFLTRDLACNHQDKCSKIDSYPSLL